MERETWILFIHFFFLKLDDYSSCDREIEISKQTM